MPDTIATLLAEETARLRKGLQHRFQRATSREDTVYGSGSAATAAGLIIATAAVLLLRKRNR